MITKKKKDYKTVGFFSVIDINKLTQIHDNPCSTCLQPCCLTPTDLTHHFPFTTYCLNNLLNLPPQNA